MDQTEKEEKNPGIETPFNLFSSFSVDASQITSSELLAIIYKTVNCPTNHKPESTQQNGIPFDDTHHTVIAKCNCKKSKCLKLYCECFSQGIYCLI